MKEIENRHYIDGQWVEGRGTALVSVNPVDNAVIWQGSVGEVPEIKKTVASAHKALPDWCSESLETRIHYLKKFADIVNSKRETLNHLISLETGKPLWESDTETNSVIAKIAISIDAYNARTQEKITQMKDSNACLRFKPQGVVVVLGAFNFPAHLSNGHIIPALLAGNTVIYKPSELAPLVAAFIMQCWHETGIPAGVISCIQGDGTTGALLLQSDIQGVFFTGSYATGKRIHQMFADRPEVILALEMGGNNPLIIDDNVEDIDAAIYQTILSAYLTAGQRCTAARRIFIKDNPSGKAFLTRLLQATQAIKVGAYTEKPEPFMGPVIRHQHALRHLEAQEALISVGGEALLKLNLLEANSSLLSPGIIDMTQATNPPDEEIFAPFLQVYRYQDFTEALQLANKTRYGLVAALISDNAEHYQQFYKTIKAGLINWNKPTTGAMSSLPFGGVGCSGNHRPSAWFAADYCAYPVASVEEARLNKPSNILPGLMGFDF
jgi:succinylglutamic semialdehyde dehydrogenase